jgi:5-hydroxyisourate hydrolase
MISTHILDTGTGLPAAGVTVTLDQRVGAAWSPLKQESTNPDGRISFDIPREPGAYRLTFGIEAYFQARGMKPFFLDVPIAFEIVDINRKYHVPLLLSSYGLSTYRGS